MKRIPLLFFLAASCARAQLPTVHCTLDENFPEGGGRGVEVTITAQSQRIVALDVSSYISNGQEAGGYICQANASRTDDYSKWSRRGTVDVIDTGKESGDTSIAAVSSNSKYFFVSTANLSRYYCGFGAAWPRHIAVPKSGGKCVPAWN